MIWKICAKRFFDLTEREDVNLILTTGGTGFSRA